MINASMALRESDNMFEKNYESEIRFIEDRIWEVVNEGLRGFNLKATSHWVNEDEDKTNRLITYFRDKGFKVNIIKIGVGNMSTWKSNCDGIEISWGEV